MNIGKLLLVAAISAALLSGCAVNGTGDVTSKSPASREEEKVHSDSYYYIWNGEAITPEIARANGCLMLGDSDADSSIWQGFLIDLESSAQAEVTICTESSVMLVAESEASDRVEMQIKENDGDRLVTRGRIISPAVVSCVHNDEKGQLEYYISNCLLYTTSVVECSGYAPVLAEFSVYEISPNAAVTFPYQECIPSYSEFTSYYELYGESLGLEELRADMESYDKEGGFNTHVVFLYGDMSGGEVEYELLRAVKDDGQLSFYLRKKSVGGTGTVTKCQLTCAVPSEYLSDVSPDGVKWVVYDDVETKG